MDQDLLIGLVAALVLLALDVLLVALLVHQLRGRQEAAVEAEIDAVEAVEEGDGAQARTDRPAEAA